MPKRTTKGDSRPPGCDQGEGYSNLPRLERPILLLTVNQRETDALRAVFGSTQEPKVFTRGDYAYLRFAPVVDAVGQPQREVIAFTCQMGSERSGAALQRVTTAIDHFEPAVVLAVGVGFGLKAKQKLGDVLIANQVTTYESVRLNKDGSIERRAETLAATPAWLERAMQITLPDIQRRSGLMLCGEKLVDNADFRESLRRDYPFAIGGDMESFGVATACNGHDRLRIGWLVIKGVSDFGDGDKNAVSERQSDFDQYQAAYRAAMVAYSAIHLRLPEAPTLRDAAQDWLQRQSTIPGKIPGDWMLAGTSDEGAQEENLLRPRKEAAEKCLFDSISGGNKPDLRLLAAIEQLHSAIPPNATRLPPHIGSVLQLREGRAASAQERRESVGRSVQWGRLADGVYAHRSILLSEAMQQYLSWVSTITGAVKKRELPIFTVGGRPGDGKSVILLQLAESILKSNPTAQIYQASHPDSLPALIDYALSMSDADDLTLFVVDDLHNVSNPRAFEESLKIILENTKSNLAVLTCGVTPHMEAFAREYQIVRLTEWTLPVLSQADLSLFSDWFETLIPRPKSIETAILVELLFVARIGKPVATFAKTLRLGLERFGVFDKAFAMIAMNSIGFSVPEIIFKTPAERDSIRRIARDDQFFFEKTEEAWGTGVRYRHAVIARTLFDEWSADALRQPSIAIRLARAIAPILGIDGLPEEFELQLAYRLRPKLLAVIQAPSSRSAHLEIDFYDELLRCTANNRKANPIAVSMLLRFFSSEENGEIDLAHVQTAASYARSPLPDIKFKALIAAQIAFLEKCGRIEENGHLKHAEELIISSGDDASVYESIAILVAQCDSSPILIDKWLRANVDACPPKHFICAALKALGPTSVLKEFTAKWLINDGQRNRGIEPLLILVKLSQDRDVCELAEAWLCGHGNSRDAGSLFPFLLRRGHEINAIARMSISWINKHSKRYLEVSLVLGALLQFGNKEVREASIPLANTFLQENWDRNVSADLLSITVSVYQVGKMFMPLAMKWVQEHMSSGQSGHLLSATLNSDFADEEVTQLALTWIAAVPQSPAAPPLASTILNTRWHDEEIRHAVIFWAQINKNNAALFNTIATLLKKAGDDKSIRKLAYEWLLKNQKSNGVPQLLSALLNVDGTNEKVQLLSYSWLKKNAHVRIAGHLISSLVRATCGSNQSCKFSHDWLNHNYLRLEAGQLLATLLSTCSGATEWVEMAAKWLDANSHRPHSQVQLLAALIRHDRTTSQWIERAILQLSPIEESPLSEPLYGALVVATPYDKRLELKLERFLSNPSHTPHYRQIVLEEWLVAGGPEGPAIECIRKLFRTRDTATKDGKKLTAMLSRACTSQWSIILGSLESDPSRSSDLSYLVGMGIAFVAPDVPSFLAEMHRWPTNDVCFIWRGVLRSDCPSSLFLEPLSNWLIMNHKKRGYGVVMDGLKSRLLREPMFVSHIPVEVADDLKITQRVLRTFPKRWPASSHDNSNESAAFE